MKTRILLISAMVALSSLATGCYEKAKRAIAHFGEGPYSVCDEGSGDDAHGLVKGSHLKLNDVISMSRSMWKVDVTLAGRLINVVASEDGKTLEAEASFDHVDASGATVPEMHLVRIKKNLNYQPPRRPNPGCDTTKNVIVIDFCTAAPGGGWTCNPDFMHQGDVHAQN